MSGKNEHQNINIFVIDAGLEEERIQRDITMMDSYMVYVDTELISYNLQS